MQMQNHIKWINIQNIKIKIYSLVLLSQTNNWSPSHDDTVKELSAAHTDNIAFLCTLCTLVAATNAIFKPDSTCFKTRLRFEYEINW